MVDLKEGVVFGKLVNGKWQQVQIPLVEGEIGTNSTPLVVNDMVIVQSAMAEGLRYEFTNNAKGLVRAFDVRTGKQIWRFNTMPGPGEFGHETWENGSWNWTGNTGVWTEMSADPEAGLVYLPVESPTIDAYGGNRPGQPPVRREPGRASTSRPASGSGTSRSCTTASGTTTCAGAPLLMDVDDRRQAAQDRRRSRASRVGSTRSTASPASRSGRSSRSRCRSPTCPARRRRRRSRSPPSRRRSRATTSRQTT